MTRSPPRGAECGPGPRASAEFNTQLTFAFPWPAVLRGVPKKRVGQGQVQYGGGPPVLVCWSYQSRRAERVTPQEVIFLPLWRLEAGGRDRGVRMIGFRCQLSSRLSVSHRLPGPCLKKWLPVVLDQTPDPSSRPPRPSMMRGQPDLYPRSLSPKLGKY